VTYLMQYNGILFEGLGKTTNNFSQHNL